MRKYKCGFQKDKINIFYLYFYFSKFILYMPFFALFFEKIRGINNAQIIQILAIYSISRVLLEIPTGVVSDRYGEKISLVIGSFSLFIAIILLTFGTLALIVFGEILFAMGEAFYSGSDEALLYHYFKNNKKSLESKHKRYDATIANCLSLSWLSLALAALLGQFLALRNLFFPFYGTIISFLIAIFVIIQLPKSEISNRRTNMLSILKHSLIYIHHNSALKFWLLISSLFLSVLIVGYFLLQPYLNELNIAGPYNGFLYFLITLFAFISSKSQSYFGKKVNNKNLLLIILCLFLSLTFLFFSLLKTMIGFIIGACLFRTLWGYVLPFFYQELNYSIKEDSLRSSILSFNSLMTSLFGSILLWLFSLYSHSIKLDYLILGSLIGLLMLILLSNSIYLKKTGKTNI